MAGDTILLRRGGVCNETDEVNQFEKDIRLMRQLQGTHQRDRGWDQGWAGCQQHPCFLVSNLSRCSSQPHLSLSVTLELWG
jgi:hypothetical protein